MENQPNKVQVSEKTILEILKSLHDIKDCLLGNEYNQNAGLVKKVENQEERIRKLEKRYNKLTVIISIIVALGNIIIGILVKDFLSR